MISVDIVFGYKVVAPDEPVGGHGPLVFALLIGSALAFYALTLFLSDGITVERVVLAAAAAIGLFLVTVTFALYQAGVRIKRDGSEKLRETC